MLNVLSRILTVSELTTQVRSVLEGQFPIVWVEGQVSNLRRPSSGHQYFTLKDQFSQIRVVLFRSVAQHLPFDLEEGLDVIIRGAVTVYEARGDYQIILERVEPKGIGALQLAFEQLKAKLEGEGLFDHTRKRTLPFFPSPIGIVTSQQGAALYDMLSILRRRCPSIPILIYPVLVQGEEASGQIAEAIRALNARKIVDVIIVGRGGGSLEDLWAFNEEEVVRAIASSIIPVISAVGHETDVTLADLAADVRAPTPSAAAEIVAPSQDELRLQVLQFRNRIIRSVHALLERCQHQAHAVRTSLPDPSLWLLRSGQQVDELETRLGIQMKGFHQRLRVYISHLESRLFGNTLSYKIQSKRELVPQLWMRMAQGLRAIMKVKRQQGEGLITLMHSLSPLTVLTRGYSLVETQDGKTLVQSIKKVAVGDFLYVRLVDGKIKCHVKEVADDSPISIP